MEKTHAPATPPVAAAPTLVPVYRGDRVWNGVTTTHDGKVFVSFPQADGPGVQLAELDANGKPQPFPNPSWKGCSRNEVPRARHWQARFSRGGARLPHLQA